MFVEPREKTFHTFSAISQGKVFLYKGHYYMKTSTAILSEKRDHQHLMQGCKHFKCVRLKDGELCDFPDNPQVTEFPDAIISPGRES